MASPAIDNAGSKISDVASALRQNQAHETADLDDLVRTLAGSANKIYAGAEQLATDCDEHKQALVQLRTQIEQAPTASTSTKPPPPSQDSSTP